ncbi:MAG: DUF6519 domain-containing protein [Acidobacteriota bacterium]
MMKGDFSRLTFDPKKHYRRVLMQQGRVQVDADWNEQEAINQHRAEVEARDVIGRCGAPIHDAGFRITVNNKGELVIGKGRFYAGGILCENDTDIGYLQQPDLPDTPKPADVLKGQPFGIVYLDVWERHITALDDPRIREIALGGPDTATRSQIVWQVKILPVKPTQTTPGANAQPTCGSKFAEWDALTASTNATLNARTQPPGNDSPCLIPPTAGYQRLENQLYRVEVHKGGALGTATFKWSRDNGSVVTTIEKPNGQELTVSDVGPDNVLGFANGQWVEVIDDRTELLSQPGQLIQIDKVDAATRTVTLKSAPAGIDLAKHPKLRRWDSVGELKVEVPATNGGWIALEGGIQVHFDAVNYRTGDYWLIPARTATGEIEWPPFQVPNATPLPQPPVGIKHHYCRLALLQFTANGSLQVIEDCRPLFPPLTEIGADAGIHVTAVNLNATKQLLHNDSDVAVVEFAQGLEIVCDADVFPDSLSSSSRSGSDNPVCIITLDLPYPFSTADRQLWGDNVIGFQPVILAARVSVAKNSITWLPATATQSWLLQQLFSMLREFKRGDRVLAHLTLKGNFVWVLSDSKLYLDGEVFGFDREKMIDVRFPSGDGTRGGDLEMWFWLVSPPSLVKVNRVRILNTGGNLGNPSAPVLATMASPPQTLNVSAQLSPNTIEVQFTGAVDQASVVNGKSFIVVNASTGATMNGQILFIANDTVRWAPIPGTAPVSLQPGGYRILLKGEGGSVITANGVALDGEPSALPSGNNVAGGDFTFSLTVTNQG